MKAEILYGFHPVMEAFKAGKRNFLEVYIGREKTIRRAKEVADLCRKTGVPLRYIPSDQLKSLTGVPEHQGIVARVSPLPLLSLKELLENNKIPFLVMLDHVVDPHNLGAIVRTALGVGVDGIVISKDRSASPTASVSKVSAGALEHLPIVRVVNMVNAIKILKKMNIWVVGLDRSAEDALYAKDLTGPLTFIIGGEEKGLRPLIKESCDFLVSIPQTGPVESLNASVAAAVALYEVFRQRARGRFTV